MKMRESLLSALVSGLLVLVPLYLAVLLLLKAVSSLMGAVRPVAGLLPDWLPADQLLSLLLVLVVCVLVGYCVHTRIGEKVWGGLERPLIRKIPGYASIRRATIRPIQLDLGTSLASPAALGRSYAAFKPWSIYCHMQSRCHNVLKPIMASGST